MQNKTDYDPSTGQYTINPSSPEEEAIKAEFREKERLEQEAFLRKHTKDAAAKKDQQKEDDNRKKQQKHREECSQYERKKKNLRAEGKTEAEILALLGPYPTSYSAGNSHGDDRSSIRF